MLVDELTVSGLLKVLQQMQANDVTVNRINEISGEDLSTLVSNLQDVQEKLTSIQTIIEECETRESIFKAGIVDAIKNVDSSASVTSDSSLSDFTSSIQSILPNVTNDANATANQILKDKTAYVKGAKVTGTIALKGATTYTPGINNQTIAAGQYLSGVQTIVGDADLLTENIKTGVNIFGVSGTFTSDATAEASHILKDKIAYVKGNKVTGTMNNYDGVITHIDYSRIANNRVEFACAQGYHGCYWNGNSYEYMTYDEILNLIGCSADKIISGQSILDRVGTGINGYQCISWKHTIGTSQQSPIFKFLGRTKILSDTSYQNVATSSYDSSYDYVVSELAGKMNDLSFAVCRVTCQDYDIRRGNGYSSGTTTASYRYLKEIVLFADNFSGDSGSSNVNRGPLEVNIPPNVLYGTWYDASAIQTNSSTSVAEIYFQISNDGDETYSPGYVQVLFHYNKANTLAFRGSVKFEFWVFYK